ncbi:MAG: toll/interleukin-1 receptor domain-containing protein, partial [Pseudomonadota bacterium]
MSQRPFAAYSGDEPFVFVSYAHADSARVYPLLLEQRERGVQFWYAEGIEPGSTWRDELASAIDRCDRVLFLASERSVASKNCLKELNFALARDKRIIVANLETVALPDALELSLGDEQAVHAEHYDAATFADKLHRALTGDGQGQFQARGRASAPHPARNRVLAP